MQEMKFISFFFLRIDIDLVSIKSAWLFSQEQVQLFLLHAYSSIKKILIIVWTLFNWKLSQWKILVQYHILFVCSPLGELLCCWRLYYIKTDPLNSKIHTILKLLIFCMVWSLLSHFYELFLGGDWRGWVVQLSLSTCFSYPTATCRGPSGLLPS